MNDRNRVRLAAALWAPLLASVVIAVGGVMSGCGALTGGDATTPVVVTVPTVPTVPTYASGIAAVACGLTYVDSNKYGGWDGACPGTGVDVQAFAALCRARGIPTAVLTNGQATLANAVAAATLAAKTLKAGDTLILYYTGHGGQVADSSGDEVDGQDETICLYDGQLADDVVWLLLCRLPEGVRVVMVTDSCNSGTNYRGVHSYKPTWRDIATFKGSLLHIGGCADGEASYGTDAGGTLTSAMMKTWRPGMTYAEWFEAVKAVMPKSQVPTLMEEGPSFKHEEALK